MTPYTRHILPAYLNRTMRSKDFEKHRSDIVSEVSGTGIEIGFGSGLNLPFYKNITKLCALDPSKELYDLAQDDIAKVSFPVEYLQASAEHIPLPDNSLDFAVSSWSLCSIPHPEMALKEIFRVLKLGGIFSFVEHGKSPRSFIFKLQNILTPISKRFAGGCHMNRDIEQLILDAGFEMKKLEKFSEKAKPLGYMYKGVGIAKK